MTTDELIARLSANHTTGDSTRAAVLAVVARAEAAEAKLAEAGDTIGALKYDLKLETALVVSWQKCAAAAEAREKAKTAALEAAAKSLEWISTSGAQDHDEHELRQYAASRARVARAALAAGEETE